MKSRLLFLFGFLLLVGSIYAQPDTITTAPPLVANNGQSGVTFEFESTQPVNIIDLECIFNGATTANLWMRIGGVLHTGATSPNISTTNGWSQVITNAPVSGGSTTTKGLMDFGGTKIAIPANTRIGFFVEAALRYQTGTAADQTTFTDGTASVFVTDAIAFGGALPSPTFNPRRFLGSVIYELGVSGNCTPFTNFAFTNITGTSADVSWTPGTGNTSFYMEYGVAGFTPGTGTTVTGTHPGAQPPVLLTGLLPQTTYDVYFGEICNAGADSVSFPTPQSFTTTKLCAPPNTLAISNVLATTADVSWMYPGTANDFDIIYGPVGFDPTTAGTSVTVTSSPHTLTGLNPATAYDAYVVANCGMTNGYSDTIGPEFFFTNCAITAAPFTEKFDNATWVASGNNNGNQLNPCWSSSPDVSNTAAFKWIPRSTGPTSGNGPLSDFTGGNFLYCEASGSSAGQIAELVSPLIDVSGLTTPALYFMQHRYYTTTSPPAPMDVEVSNDGGTTWSNVYSISGNTQSSSGDPWELVFVNLGAYIGDTIQLKFIQTSVGCCGDAAIDSVVVDEAPLCPWPTNVAITGITSTTADFSWADPTGTSWDVEWGPCGYSQGTGTFANTSTNPYTATGLAPNTCYDMYVRANCNTAGNGTSIWIGPIEFRTACSPFTAPYSDNFDANVANVVPICWNAIREVQTGTAAAIETYTFAVPNSAPNHIRMYNGSGQWANGDATILISPEFSDLTAGDKRVQFFAYKTTTALVTLIVGTMDKADTSGTFSPIDTVTLNSTSNHELFIVDVDNSAGYNGTDTYIGLAHGMSSTFQTIYIDDFSYGFVPLCNPPLITTLGVGGTGTTTASVFWGSGSDGDETHIEWGAPGFTPGTGSYLGKDSVPGTQDMYTIQGLSAQTTYEYYIQDSCVGNGFSPWVGPISFTTQCNVLTAPLVENFDGTSWVASGNNAGNMLDPCWASTPDVSQGSEPFKWIPRSTGPTSGNGPLNDLTGGNFMYVEASGSTNGDIAYLYSPLIDVSALTAPALYFWQHRYYTATSPPADMHIEVTNDNGVTWTNVYTITGNIQTSASGPWQDELVNLPQFVGDTIQIRFKQDGLGCCGDAAIDSVAIAEAPSCPDAASLSVTNIAPTSATLNWAGAVTALSNEVWYGPQGFFQGTTTGGGTKVLVPSPASSYALSGLMPNTCYEFLVRGICGPGDTSNWVGPVVFCTPCLPFVAPFIEDFTSSTLGHWAGEDNCWNFVSNNPSTSGTGGYSWEVRNSATSTVTGPDRDNTLWPASGGTFIMADVSGSSTAGPDSTLLISPIIDISGLINPELKYHMHRYGTIMADLHVDIYDGTQWIRGVHSFTNLQGTQSSAADAWTDTTFNLSAYAGTTNLQVRFRSVTNGCCNGDNAIDDVSISEPITDDAQINDILVAEGCGDSTTAISVVFTNKGLNAITSMPVTVGVSGSITTTFNVTYTGNLAKNASDTVVVGTINTYSGAQVSISADLNLAGDNLPGNDTLTEGPFGFLPFEPQVYPGDTVCVTQDSVDLAAVSIPGVGYGWYANTTDTVPLALGDSATVALGGNTTFYAQYQSNSDSLSTSFGGGNGQAGNAFDILPVNTITITGVDMHIDNTSSHTLDVYFKTGTYVGNETSLANWTLHETITINGQGVGNSTPAPFTNPYIAQAGQIYGVMLVITSGGSVDYTNGSSVGAILAQNSDLIIYEGAGVSWPLASNFTPRFWNGTFHYGFQGCSQLRVPVNFTLSSDTASASFTSAPGSVSGEVLFDASASINADSYSWDFGDGNMGTGVSPSHIYTATGTYYVTLTVTDTSGNCTGTVMASDTIIPPVIGLVENNLSRSIEVYPNPSNGIIHLSFDPQGSAIGEVLIRDMTGRLIIKENYNDLNGRFSETYDLSNLPDGVYLLEINSGELSAVRRLNIK